MPALYRLSALGLLDAVSIVGYALEDWNREHFIAHLERNVRRFARDFNRQAWPRFASGVDYRSGDLTAERLAVLETVVPGAGLFYLALPPELFGSAAEALGRAGLARDERGWRRLVVEKPFGSDPASAESLRERIHRGGWAETQVYRIDHFLGRQTAMEPPPTWETEGLREHKVEVLRFPGRPTGSAMPLVWAQAEFLKLRYFPALGHWEDRDHRVGVAATGTASGKPDRPQGAASRTTSTDTATRRRP